ncbi:MAG: hypothetical protein RLY67_677, partial [Pseudomonadota bacterium]
ESGGRGRRRRRRGSGRRDDDAAEAGSASSFVASGAAVIASIQDMPKTFGGTARRPSNRSNRGDRDSNGRASEDSRLPASASMSTTAGGAPPVIEALETTEPIQLPIDSTVAQQQEAPKRPEPAAIPSPAPARVPDPSELQASLNQVGLQWVQTDPTAKPVAEAAPEAPVSLGRKPRRQQVVSESEPLVLVETRGTDGSTPS